MTFEEFCAEAGSYYALNPVDFIEDILGVELDTWQKEVLNTLVRKHFVAIRSGSGVGKTFLMSATSMWFIATHPMCKIPTTAPSQHQLFDNLWGEHFKLISRSDFLKSMLIWTQTKVSVKNYEPVWYAVARTAKSSPDGEVAEGLQGFHAEESLLFLLDEGSGIPDAIFPAMEGALTGPNAFVLIAGNPTRRSGYFYDIFNDPRMANLYAQFHISCYDTPRTGARYLEMMEKRYGKDHPIFQIKVEGNFPSSDLSLLFPPTFIEVFRNNVVREMPKRYEKAPIEIGVDIGRSVNRSIAMIHKGDFLMKPREKYLKGGTVDTLDLRDWIVDMIEEFHPRRVKIDAVGIGAGVYDTVRALYPNITLPIIGSNKSSDSERYANVRSHGYWSLREKIANIYSEQMPNDRLVTEMGNIRYNTSHGKIQIESKDDVTGGKRNSPDYADALMYAFIDPEQCVSKRENFIVTDLSVVNSQFHQLNAWGSSMINSGDFSGSRWKGGRDVRAN